MAADAFDAMRRLGVWKDSVRVGTLEGDHAGRLRFTYLDSALHRPELAVSVRMPVRRKPWEDADAMACFENLLPEGDLRTHIAQATHMAGKDVSGLLGVIGGECAGALTLWADGLEPPEPPQYEPCSARSLGQLFDGASTQYALLQKRTRQAMSGAQDKVVLLRRPGGTDTDEYLLPRDGAPGTVLCKRDRGMYPGLVHNELAGMSLMACAGVPTATHAVNRLDATIYETVRFDRVAGSDGRIRRLHAEDGCQMTGHTSLAKYADPRGPSYQSIMAALRRHSADAITDGERLLRWAIANIVIGNRDAHAKNISILHDLDDTIRLAPAYDVLCTLVYPIETKLPLPFGGHRRTTEFTPAMWRVVAREFSVTAAYAREVADDVITRVRTQLDDVLQRTEQVAGPHDVLARVGDTVKAECAQLRSTLAA
jgi:serine/threonine-protein kinase HipA